MASDRVSLARVFSARILTRQRVDISVSDTTISPVLMAYNTTVHSSGRAPVLGHLFGKQSAMMHCSSGNWCEARMLGI